MGTKSRRLEEREPRIGAFLRLVIALAFLAGSAVSAWAQNLDVTGAQADMHNRISEVVNSYARKIGANSDLVTYCRIELSLYTTKVPLDGSIPYGVNYNDMAAQGHLDTVIQIREAHERNFLLLCLARSMRDLKAIQ